MTWLGPRSLACMIVLAAPACVIKLSDRNAPIENGGVTGDGAACGSVPVTPHATIGTNPEIKFVGRFDMRDPQKIRFDWSGNEIVARFEGSSVRAYLTAYKQDVQFIAQVDDLPPVKKLIEAVPAANSNEPAPQEFVIAEGLGPGPHQVILHRNTEAQSGPSAFLRFDFGGGRLLPPPQRARRIEMIGDSITCGYGNEGQNATCPYSVTVRRDEKGDPVNVPVTENQWLAYGSLVGRQLDADVTTVCWSGKGVYFNYRVLKDDPTRDATIPQLWSERTIGGVDIGEPPEQEVEGQGLVLKGPPWDFTKEPEYQAVVINLGTNDFTRDVEDNETGERKQEGDNVPDGTIYKSDPNGVPYMDLYRSAFVKLVRDVRARRPNAHIFLATPPMITDQYPLDDARKRHFQVLLDVVSEMEKSGDKKVYAMELVEQGTRYGLGCDYHPNLRVHELMAEQVAGAIRSKTCWD